ncbi:hypothetical protein BWQ96_06430 [Gracilariopsis chorda]|uniref:Uncharacterized protein n=1 Tax=Gracilariopsis chorda TaxID=448386 RepID=A0A2V3IP29_9FLOR|nr:hypothetical protein BWQ96_06430 [Gracilariopsis chorda]|eukprot:PXF43809.1 hypothetical protein BWQ96_06430 [Gracilariopsis chorda]
MFVDKESLLRTDRNPNTPDIDTED